MKRFYSLIVLAIFLCCGTTVWGAQSLPYSYGFEDYELSTDGWTKQNPSNKNNSKFVINGTSKRTGSYGFQFSSYTDNGENTQYLISPELDAANGVDVSFYYKNSNSGKAEVFKVGYSTTDTEIASFTFGDEISKSDASWEEYTNSFPAGTKYIAVYYYSTYQYYLFVDDFHFEAPASCATPTDVKATQNTPVKATLSWTKAEGKDNYQYLYVAKGETPNWNSVVAQNTNSVEIDGLTSGVEYDFYVRTYCDSEDQSEAVKKTFSVTCPAPTFPTTPVTDLSASGATITWNAVDGISKYQYLCVVKDADTTGLWATVEAKEGLSAELTSLTAKTHYDFYVRSWYSATSISDAVKTTFRTDADCSAIVVDADHTWEEDFSGFEVGNENSDAPDCWALLNANAGSRPYIYISASGTSWFSLSNNALYFSNVNTKYGYAIFPAFATALNTLQITFDQKVESASSSGAIELGYMTNITNESTFNLLLSCNKSTSWKSENVILTAVPVGARLAFRYKATSSSYYDAAVDNIVVSLAPACFKPSDVKTTALDSVSATITWTNGGEETSWKLQYSTDKNQLDCC